MGRFWQKKSIDAQEVEVEELVDGTEEEIKREEGVANQLFRNQYLRTNNISIGNCSECPLKNGCEYYNETDSECRFIRIATNDFYNEIVKVPHVKDVDLIAARSLASMHGIVAISELYFQMFGSITTIHNKEGELLHAKFNPIMEAYQKIFPIYMRELGNFGMTPKGRASIEKKGGNSENAATMLEAYLDSKLVKDVPGKAQDECSRVLQGSSTSESTSLTSSRSYSKSNLRPVIDEE